MACSADNPTLRRVAVGVFALGLLVSAAALVRTWYQPILDAHAFRQTQTAITSYWLWQGGPFFDYETPTLGAPWSIPFELPLYQAIVAGVRSLRIHLDAAGRLVSWAFFLLTLWQLHALVRKLGGSRHLGLLLCGLLLLSPHYVFWSRAFMIESTALFFSVAFVSAVASHMRTPTVWSGAAMCALAMLGALIKVTSFVPFAIIALLLVLWDLRVRAHRHDARRWATRYAPVALAGAVALAALSLWTRHADALKLAHPFGRNLTSANLSPWLYGTLAQRTSLKLWKDVVFGRALDEALGSGMVLLATIAAAIVLGRRALAWAAVLVGLYVIPFLLFTNLHLAHNYYQYSNALFAICAVGVVAWHARAGWRRWIGPALVGLLVIAQLERLAQVEWPLMVADKDSGDTLQIGLGLFDLPANGVLLVFGYDWSAELAYYARHRAIAVPIWASREQLESLRRKPMLHTGGLPIVAVVECPSNLHDNPEIGAIFDAIMAEQTGNKQRTSVGSCTVWR
jgi:hypothetical protein